jgi:hypothetical protein
MQKKFNHKSRIFLFSLTFCTILVVIASLPVYSTQFEKPLNVSKSRARIDTQPAIAVDKNNKVHIAWNAFYAKPGAPDGVAADIYYTNNISGNFIAPIRIRVAAGWYSRDPSIAVDSKGHAHIVFRRSQNQTSVLSEDDIYYVTNAKGDFKYPILLVDGKCELKPTDVPMPHDPIIHCDSRGHLHLTFQAWGVGDNYEKPYYLIYMNNVTGSWTKPSIAARGDFITEHHSCLDRNNFVHIAYQANDAKHIGHVFYTNNRSRKFSKPMIASSSKHDHPIQAQIATDSKGKAHIVYRAPFVTPGTPDLFYVNNVSGNFKKWKALCPWNTYYIPSIAVDNSDVVHIAYKGFPAYGGYLYYGNNSNGDFKFTSYGGMGDSWYIGSSYFSLGKSLTLHFAFFDWVGSVYDSDTEIFYLAGSWAN